MKTISAVILLSCCFFCRARSQTLFPRWEYAWGGNMQEFLANMITLPGNQYLFGGSTASNPSCTKSGTLYGGVDFAIFALDDNGNKLWEKTYGGSGNDQLYQIAKVPSGGYILVGGTQSGPSGIKTSPAYGDMDIWVVRVDDNYNMLWEKTLGGAGYELAEKVTPTPDGGFLVAGNILSNAPGYTYGSTDYLLIKLDANGNQLWQKRYGGASLDYLIDMLPLPNGNYLLSGFSSSPPGGNKTAPSLGDNDKWLVCIQPDGAIVWNKSYGTAANDAGGSLLALQDGNYLITGYIISGSTGSTVTGDLRKIDAQGNQIWYQTCAGQGSFIVSCETPAGDIYVGGQSAQGIQGCKTSPLAGGLDDYWITVFNAAGNKIGDMDFGGNDEDQVSDIKFINGDLWLVGWSDSYISGNKTVPNCGQTADGWIIRLTRSIYVKAPTPTDICSNINSFDVSFSAFNIYQANNVFTAQLSDANGSFAAPVDIGHITAVQSGTIPVTLPAGLPAGNLYQIRVLASQPADTSAGYPISIHGLPILSLGNDTTICDNLPLTLRTGTQSPGTKFLWNDGSTGSSLTVSAPGTYSCDAQNSCGAASDIIHITTRSIPVADIGSDIIFCEGSNITLHSSPQPADVSYLWNNDATTSSITVDAGGDYWLHTTNSCGTTGDTILATMNPAPLSILDKNNLLCYGTTRVLDPGSGFSDYLWNDGQGGQTRTVSTPGLYWVRITGSNGCEKQDTAIITRIAPLPAAFLPPDTSLCAYQDITLTSAIALNLYEWSTGESSSSIYVNQPGLYWLQATDNYGCTGRDSILVSHKDCPYGFFMPSAFTPNQDGKNDLCHPLIYGRIGKFHFTIFNRWGQKVFETSDPVRGWDGNLNGQPAPAGTFVWNCLYQLGGGPDQFAKGTVILVR